MRSSGERSNVHSSFDTDIARTKLRIPIQPLFFIARVMGCFSVTWKIIAFCMKIFRIYSNLSENISYIYRVKSNEAET